MIKQENALMWNFQLKELEMDLQSTASPSSELFYNDVLSPCEAQPNQNLSGESRQGHVNRRSHSKTQQFEAKNIPGLIVQKALKDCKANLERESINGEQKDILYCISSFDRQKKTYKALRKYFEKCPQLGKKLRPIVRHLLTDEETLEAWILSNRMSEITKDALRRRSKIICRKLLKVMEDAEEESSLEPLPRKMIKIDGEVSDFENTFDVDDLREYWKNSG